jgi:hypothetical protein
VKDNPGEYVVIAGIVILTVGTFIMCFSDGFSLRRFFKKDGQQISAEKKGVKKHG